MTPSIPYLSIVSDKDGAETAIRLSELLGVPVQGCDTTYEEPVSQYRLHVSGSGLQLEFPFDRRRKPWIAELVLRRPSIGRDPLLRAIGTRTGTVVDMTAGWCTDAALIAISGCRVTAFEQNPLIHALSRHALDHCSNHSLRRSVNLIHGDSRELLGKRRTCADVVYLDPMYPGRGKSAASPGSAVLLRELVRNGADHSQSPHRDIEMLETAQQHARKRVVVKRPRHAPPIHSDTTGEVCGKQVRFDLYRPKR